MHPPLPNIHLPRLVFSFVLLIIVDAPRDLALRKGVSSSFQPLLATFEGIWPYNTSFDLVMGLFTVFSAISCS